MIMNNHPVSGSSRAAALLIAGALVVGAVVVLRGADSSSAAVSGMDKSLEVLGKKEKSACMKKMESTFRRAMEAKHESVESAISVFPFSRDVVFGYEQEDGEQVVESAPSFSKAARIMSAQDGGSAFAKSDDHKTIRLEDGGLVFLFRNNMVVAVDGASCEIEGVYLADKKGNYHEKVAQSVSDKMPVAEDKCNSRKQCACSNRRGYITCAGTWMVQQDTMAQTVWLSKCIEACQGKGYSEAGEHWCGCDGVECAANC